MAKRARRRLKKRQGNSNLKKGVDVYTAARLGYETLTSGYKAANKIADKLRDRRKKKSSKGKKAIEDRWLHGENGIKFNSRTIAYKPSKIGKLTQKLSQLGATYEILAAGAVGNPGQQQVTVLSSVLGLNTVISPGNSGTAQINNLFVQLNNEVVLPVGAYSRQMLLKSITHEFEFCNEAPSTCEFQLYFLIDKITSPTNNTPIAVWDSAVGNEQGVAATIPVEAKETLWQQPTTFKQWNINFWTKSIKCSLTPGERCKFTWTFKPNRVLDTSYFENFQAIRGITHYVMLVQRGVLSDTSNAKTLIGGQTTSDTKMIYLHKRTMRGSILSTLPRINKQLGAPLTTAPTALWNIDEDTGEPENQFVTTEFA